MKPNFEYSTATSANSYILNVIPASKRIRFIVLQSPNIKEPPTGHGWVTKEMPSLLLHFAHPSAQSQPCRRGWTTNWNKSPSNSVISRRLMHPVKVMHHTHRNIISCTGLGAFVHQVAHQVSILLTNSKIVVLAAQAR